MIISLSCVGFFCFIVNANLCFVALEAKYAGDDREQRGRSLDKVDKTLVVEHEGVPFSYIIGKYDVNLLPLFSKFSLRFIFI